jgi:hypothetical protein
MNDLIGENIVAVIRYKKNIYYYKSDRLLWVLDLIKWREQFLKAGYFIPEFDNSIRYGIHILNNNNVELFLDQIKEYEIERDNLSIELAERYQYCESTWDVMDLFPIIFVDFDNRKVGAFYSEGIPMESYVPSGWIGEFVNFFYEYSEDIFPEKEKFWIKDGCDLLKLLNERTIRDSTIN